MLQVELVSKWFFLCFLAEVGTITLAILRCLKNKRNAVREGSRGTSAGISIKLPAFHT